MKLDVQVREARQLFAASDSLSYNHHVCFFNCHADVVASEIFRKQGELFQVFGTPVLRWWQVVLDEILALAEAWNINENLALETSKESLVNFPENEISLELKTSYKKANLPWHVCRSQHKNPSICLALETVKQR